MTVDPFTESMNEITLASAADGERVPVVAVLRAMMALRETISDQIAALSATVNEICEEAARRTLAIADAKREVMESVEQRQHWPVLDEKLAELRSEMVALQMERRHSDPPTADYRGVRFTDKEEEPRHSEAALAHAEGLSDVTSKRYTREQIVAAAIIAVLIVIMNAGVTWVIIRALEAQYQ